LNPSNGNAANTQESPSRVSPRDDAAPAQNPKKPPRSDRRFILTLDEWSRVEFDSDGEPILGTPKNAIVRPGTKNIVEAAEKSFKTSVLYPLALGLACGQTVYPELPVSRAYKVLYLHGELSKREIAERQEAALKRRRYCAHIDGGSYYVHYAESEAQSVRRDVLVHS